MSLNPRIAPRRQLVDAALLLQYRSISSSTIGHVLDTGYLRGLRPLFEGIHMIGNVVTARLRTPDGSILRDALLCCEPGDVLVIECEGDRECACWGELRTLAALIKGLAGVVVSGAVTDVAALREHRLPIFSRGVSALTTRSLGQSGELNLPVRVGDVQVQPGDLAIGDDDGVFILTAQQARELLPQFVAKENADRLRRAGLLAKLIAKGA
ncbi:MULTISPECIES: RraA family protein [Pseudomonas]|uniref:Putative 4-hydroxy-4-methyl-2-oxoglutarate aldolase n=1 Tax=Pseudomonas asplenii TaxID=53407 RepID=A0A0M9GHI6_9PSED|nr:RraA family protein [Pseudomonas fuscovaginae]KPA91347.1 Demethylmenaquinone methyltransferase [Pseudomonas fuscovaginae]KPA96297.1 Demethylmenaquinone methyltransferase [Pseudomonas fuscovaginae]